MSESVLCISFSRHVRPWIDGINVAVVHQGYANDTFLEPGSATGDLQLHPGHSTGTTCPAKSLKVVNIFSSSWYSTIDINWIASIRFPRRDNTDLRYYKCEGWFRKDSRESGTVIMEDEIATLQCVHQKTSIPVPQVYGYDLKVLEQ